MLPGSSTMPSTSPSRQSLGKSGLIIVNEGSMLKLGSTTAHDAVFHK